MLFNSYQFLLFFPIVVGVYFFIPRRSRYLWLLVASYYFYMSWNAKYALLLAFFTLVTWLSGLAIAKVDERRKLNEFACAPGGRLFLSASPLVARS